LLHATGLMHSTSYKFRNGPLEVRLQLSQPGESLVARQQSPEKSKQVRQKTAVSLTPGAVMFANRLRKNRQRLKSWLSYADTNCYRLYDADIPEYAVAVDCYADWVQVSEYAAPSSIDAAQAAARLSDVRAVVAEQLNTEPEKLIIKRRQRQRGSAQYQRRDDRQQNIEVYEGEARLYVNLQDYLDTGLFLDHRPVRRLLAGKAKDKRFLNLYCYTGTATVHAALGGAAESVSVDLSATYLKWAQRNFEVNKLSDEQHRLERADCLRWVEQCNDKYDLIFLDPPSFSNSKRMQTTIDVQRDHVTMIRSALALLAPGGEMLFSTNRRGFRIDLEALSELQIEDLSSTTVDPDFARKPGIHKVFIIHDQIDATS